MLRLDKTLNTRLLAEPIRCSFWNGIESTECSYAAPLASIKKENTH